MLMWVTAINKLLLETLLTKVYGNNLRRYFVIASCTVSVALYSMCTGHCQQCLCCKLKNVQTFGDVQIVSPSLRLSGFPSWI